MNEVDLRVTPVSAPIRTQIVAKIKAAIADGTFAPGDRIVERVLSELTGASRSSLREAIRELETDGLLRREPGRGLHVTDLSHTEIDEIYEVRAALEGLAARLFTERASDEDRERLEAAYDRLVASEGTPQALVAVKADFYSILMSGSRNQMITTILDGLQGRISALRIASLSQPGRPEASRHEVHRIIAAVRARDAAEAHRAAAAHVEAAAHTLREMRTAADAAR